MAKLSFYGALRTHFVSVSVLSFRSVQLEVIVIVKAVPVLLRLQNSLQQRTCKKGAKGMVRTTAGAE